MEAVFTSANFDVDVLGSDIPVVVDFFATWCGPCQMLASVLEGIEALHPEIKLGTVDTDDQAYLARQFGISSIPTLLFFKDGQVVARSTGYCGEAAIEELISR